jgi:hypothetical protein
MALAHLFAIFTTMFVTVPTSPHFLFMFSLSLYSMTSRNLEVVLLPVLYDAASRRTDRLAASRSFVYQHMEN